MLLGKINPERRNTPGAENNPDDAAEEDFKQSQTEFYINEKSFWGFNHPPIAAQQEVLCLIWHHL